MFFGLGANGNNDHRLRSENFLGFLPGEIFQQNAFLLGAGARRKSQKRGEPERSHPINIAGWIAEPSVAFFLIPSIKNLYARADSLCAILESSPVFIFQTQEVR